MSMVFPPFVPAPQPNDNSGEEETLSEEGDITGIIEADGLVILDERPLADVDAGQGAAEDDEPRGDGAWCVTKLAIRAPRPAVVEDEDGDLDVVRRPGDCCEVASVSGELVSHEVAASLVGQAFELCRVKSSTLARVGLQLWAGALVLSDYLLARPEVVSRRRVCELGAGLGLCSLLAAGLGAKSVLCTDGSAEVVRNCDVIVRRNRKLLAYCDVQTAVVSWEEVGPPARSTCSGSSSSVPGKEAVALGPLWAAEVLLGADVVYDNAGAEALVGCVHTLLTRGSAEVLYLAIEKRIYFSAATLRAEVMAYPHFLEACSARGLEVDPIELSAVPVHFEYTRSRFYELVAVRRAVPGSSTAPADAAGSKRRKTE